MPRSASGSMEEHEVSFLPSAQDLVPLYDPAQEGLRARPTPLIGAVTSSDFA